MDQGGGNGSGEKMLSFKYILRSNNRICRRSDVECQERGVKDLGLGTWK